MSLLFSLSDLTESQKALYRTLEHYKGVSGARLSPALRSEHKITDEDLEALVEANAIFIGSKGGFMVFSDQQDVDNAHPFNKELRKEAEIKRLLAFKEVQEVLLEVVEAVGIDGLKRGLMRLCKEN